MNVIVLLLCVLCLFVVDVAVVRRGCVVSVFGVIVVVLLFDWLLLRLYVCAYLIVCLCVCLVVWLFVLNTVYTCVYILLFKLTDPYCSSPAKLSISQIPHICPTNVGRRQNGLLCSGSRSAAPLRFPMVPNTQV